MKSSVSQSICQYENSFQIQNRRRRRGWRKHKQRKRGRGKQAKWGVAQGDLPLKKKQILPVNGRTNAATCDWQEKLPYNLSKRRKKQVKQDCQHCGDTIRLNIYSNQKKNWLFLNKLYILPIKRSLYFKYIHILKIIFKPIFKYLIITVIDCQLVVVLLLMMIMTCLNAWQKNSPSQNSQIIGHE